MFFEELLRTKEICLVKGEATDFCSPEDAAQIFQQILNFYLNEDLFERFVNVYNYDREAFEVEEYKKLMDIRL